MRPLAARAFVSRAFVWCLPLCLWLVTLGFTYEYATDVPYADSWEYSVIAAGLQPLTLSFLWQQHNEHRVVWQKLFQLPLARYTAWNQYVAAFPGALLLGAGNLFFLWQVSRSRPELTTAQRVLLLGTLSLCLFSLRQHEILMWNMMASWGLLHLTVVLYGNAFPEFADKGRGTVTIGVLMAVAALCTGQGLALCVFTVLFGAVALVRRSALTAHLVLGGLALLLMAAYFVDWQTLPYHPPVMSPLRRPDETARFLFALVGSPFTATSVSAVRDGRVIVLAVAAGMLVVIWRDRGHALWALFVRYPLLIVTGIVMSSVMVGRLGFGIEQAIVPRYVPMGELFAATAVLLLFDALPRHHPAWRTLFVAGLFALAIPVWYDNFRDGVIAGANSRARLNAYRDCILVHPASSEPCGDDYVYPIAFKSALDGHVKVLRDHRLSFFARTP